LHHERSFNITCEETLILLHLALNFKITFVTGIRKEIRQ
jgi:hypothetical protein